MTYRIARLMTRAAKARIKRPELWRPKKKQWRLIDDTTPLTAAPDADRWAVLLVEPRAETKAAEALREAGYEAWYPQTVEMRTFQERMIRHRFNLPLFPRYVFAAYIGRAKTGMADCKHVSRIVGYVPQILMDNLSGRQTGGEFITKDAGHGFAKGDAVRVKDGPFSDLNGIIGKVGPSRVSVLISLFGSVRAIEMDAKILEVAA